MFKLFFNRSFNLFCNVKCFISGSMALSSNVWNYFCILLLIGNIYRVDRVLQYIQPLLMVSCAAIIAAATPSSSQNSAQSIRFVAEKFAQILSPTWVNSLNPASTSGYIGFLLLLPANIIFAASICSIYASYKFI